MSVLVQVVVGQLELVEGDHLLHPDCPGGRRVGVDVEPAGHVGFCFTGHHPFRVVVLVAGVVHGYNVHEENVLGILLQPRDAATKGREHPPREREKDVGRR